MIMMVTVSILISATWATISEDIPGADVIVGGFPCQGFSHANWRRSVEDSRNKLYTHFLRIVADKQPKYFLAENVRGILTLDGGRVMNRIVEDFDSAGYRVKHALFDVANYGVPQHRKRVIIAGTRKDLPENGEYHYPVPTHAELRTIDGLEEWISISAALEGLPDPVDSPNALPNQHYSRYKVTDRNFTGHRITDPKKPSPTILARGNGKGGVCAIQHPLNHRRLSVRECAVIQTFPRNYEFFGSMSSCYRQVGNAVPVQFAYCLGLQLAKCEEVCRECV
jgi:DNA (cytosine-5)-methyltransferase 1